MQTQWYQIWADIPYIGRQWSGWLNTDPIRAATVAQGLQYCTPGATGGVGQGFKLTILEQNGQPVPTVGGGAGVGIPDIGQILGTLGNWGK